MVLAMDEDENWRRLREAIAERIEQLRTTQRAVSLAADLDENTVGNLVLGRVKSRTRTLQAISRAMGWSPDVPERILHGEDPSTVLGSDDSEMTIHNPDRVLGLAQTPAIPKASIDFLSGNDDATAEQLLEVLDAARHETNANQLGKLVALVVERALDELVEGTGWSVLGARVDWGADLSLYDQDGNERVLVEVKSTPTQGFVPVDEIIGRAFRSRARMSKAWGRPIDFWVVFTTDPGPQVIAAFGDVDIPMGWVGHLPELPAGG
jgi:hypothetical protein